MPTEPPGDADRAQSPRAAALYIESLSAELGRLARRHHLEPLAYILEMARIEADQVAKGSGSAGASEVA